MTEMRPADVARAHDIRTRRCGYFNVAGATRGRRPVDAASDASQQGGLQTALGKRTHMDVFVRITRQPDAPACAIHPGDDLVRRAFGGAFLPAGRGAAMSSTRVHDGLLGSQ